MGINNTSPVFNSNSFNFWAKIRYPTIELFDTGLFEAVKRLLFTDSEMNAIN